MSTEKNKTEEQDNDSRRREALNETEKQHTAANQVNTDPDNDSVTTGRIAAKERGSASATKTTVAGSDLDGQTSF